MLKRLAIFGVFLIVFRAYGGADGIQGKNNHQQPAAPVSGVPQKQDDGASLDNEKQKDIHADVKIVNPPQKDFYDKAPVWIDIALIFVALGTGIVIGWQAWETRKAARGAERAADAALLNAQIVANSERPWLLVSSEHIADTVTSGVYAKNRGRTPCKIVQSAGPFWLFLEAREVLKVRYKGETMRPDYGRLTSLEEPIILLPEEATYIFQLFMQEVRDRCETEERYRMLEEGRLDLFIYGVLYYRDLLNPEPASLHATSWCCRYITSPNGTETHNRLSMMFGLPGYTAHT